MSPGTYAWTQVPVFSGIIIASAIVANFIKDPDFTAFYLGYCPDTACWPAHLAGRQSAMATRLAMVSTGNELLCPGYWTALSGAVSLHALFS